MLDNRGLGATNVANALWASKSNAGLELMFPLHGDRVGASSMVNFSRVDALSYPKTKNIIWKGFGTCAFPFPNPGGDGKQRAPYIINSKKGSRIPGARVSLTIPTLEAFWFPRSDWGHLMLPGVSLG
ncbi:hypothetical protein NLI96_g6150 [Meripilus lineatus]|uniref:Uncharacterized protein n=1 Tax=Meripilus lineatus TaxID=2056292 RepID=A0AAD5YE65_9APHY|nr:hypothetical protein NLI96_g6150 [Physisporinus lineatus]